MCVSQDNYDNHDKGVLAEILEPIMGKGLIPADLDTWKPRRRAIVPAFHRAYLNAMVSMFADCTQRSIDKMTDLTNSGQVMTECTHIHPALADLDCPTLLAHLQTSDMARH